MDVTVTVSILFFSFYLLSCSIIILNKSGQAPNKLKINSVTVIVSRNNELISENEELKDNDEIRILPVISGG